VPVHKLESFFVTSCINLLIEFIPKSDSQVKRLLANKEDIFDDYNKKNFENEFQKHFTISESNKLIGPDVMLYYMKKKR